MPFHGVEWAWNSVDVRGDDGLLHSGRVIDAVDEGLVVDFGGTEQAGPRLIPFGLVYYRCFNVHLKTELHNDEEQPLVKQLTRKERPVEMLLRVQPLNPWKWYPAVLLDSFGLISVTLADHEVRGIVEGRRIREMSTKESLAPLAVENGQFAKQLVQVPNEIGVSLISDHQLTATFNAYCRKRDYWMMATEVLSDPYHGATRKLAVLENRRPDVLYSPLYFGVRKRLPGPFDGILLSLFKVGVDAPERNRPSTLATACFGWTIQSLCRDVTILPQIFDHLSTVQQSQLRQVCWQWNAILASVHSRHITAFAPRIDGNCTRSVFRFASCLYNNWTLNTRVLLLDGGCSPPERGGARLPDTIRFLQRVMADKCLPPVKFLLLTGEWYTPAATPNWVHSMWEALQSLAGLCQTMMLKNVGVYVDGQYSSRFLKKLVVVRFSDQRFTRQLTISAFWSMLNDGLRDLDFGDVERLTKWMKTDRPNLAKVLNITQTVDPRDGVRYGRMSSDPYGNAGQESVDVRELTRLTLHALLQCLREEDGRDVFCGRKLMQFVMSSCTEPRIQNAVTAGGSQRECALRQMRDGKGIKTNKKREFLNGNTGLCDGFCWICFGVCLSVGEV